VVRVAQLILEWNKKSPKKVELKGGHIPGKILGPKDVEALAKVPARPVVLSIIAGGFEAPLRKIATIMVAPVQNMSYAFNGLVKKMEEQQVEKVSDLK
jgi:large subunit ribosomal protein L10